MKYVRHSFYHTLCGLILSLSAWGVALQAQARTTLPDTTTDFARYVTGEECLAAVKRVSKRIDAVNPIWQDTTPFIYNDKIDSLPSEVRRVARDCAARFRADTLPLAQYVSWIAVLLAADRDADAKLIADRRLASAAQDSVAVQKRVLQRVYDTYATSSPFRVAIMDSIITRIERLVPATEISDRITAMSMRIGLADLLGDDIMKRQAAERIVAFAETLTPDQRMDKKYETYGRSMVHWALDIIRKGPLLDSLRKSAAAFVALKQANWAAASGRSPQMFPSMVGKMATPIEADFWFIRNTTSGESTSVNSATGSSTVSHSQPSSPVRPTPGRVGLIVFLSNECHAEAPWVELPYGRESIRSECRGTYAILRRLGQRFPNLEMTIVSQTTGYMGSTAPLSPEEEARLQRQWWLGFYHLPATLAVTNTPFFRLPAPDNRRIDQVFENKANYWAGNNVSWQGRAFIVDPSGTIIYEGGLWRSVERDVIAMLDAVMTRYNQNSARQ